MFTCINRVSRYAEIAPALLNLILTSAMFFNVTDSNIPYGVLGISVLHLGAGVFALLNDFLDPLSKTVSWSIAVVMVIMFAITSTQMLVVLMIINVFATLIQTLLMWREIM
jgi:hypothetical protein